MEVGLEIGNRWGQTIKFNFDLETLQILEPDWEIYTKKEAEPEVDVVENYDDFIIEEYEA